MPLPHFKKTCTATVRTTGNQCRNPAAWGCKTCRMHGARPPQSIKRGADHPNFKHGRETLEARQAYREASARLLDLRMECIRLGLIEDRGKSKNRKKRN